MDEDDEEFIGWEDGDDGEDEGDLIWEDRENVEDEVEQDIQVALPNSGTDHLLEDEQHEPEERRWLGNNGEIIVELPTEDGVLDEAGGGEPAEEDGAASSGSRAKAKAKPHRFTAEEIRKALDVHTAHLACLVARWSLVNRWAGDPAVQAAMVSCLPQELIPQGATGNRSEAGGAAGRDPSALATLVVWFHDFLTVEHDAAVGSGGSGGSGAWGSRPSRLLRVIDQRVGCPQEAVQLFVGLCRGLGLQARYVACLDPLPPHPRPPGSSKQTRANTVDLVAEEMDMERQRQRHRQRHRGGPWGCGQGRVRLMGARSWAEVLCKDGKDLHVWTSTSAAPEQPSTKAAASLCSKESPRAGEALSAGKLDRGSSSSSSLPDEKLDASAAVEVINPGASSGGKALSGGNYGGDDGDDSYNAGRGTGADVRRSKRGGDMTSASSGMEKSGGGVGAKRVRSGSTGSGSREVHAEKPRTRAGSSLEGGSQGTSVRGQAKAGSGRARKKPRASSSLSSSVREDTSGDIPIVDKSDSRRDGRDKHDSSATRGVGRPKREAGRAGGASADVGDRTVKEGRDEAPAEREVSADGIASKMTRAGETAAIPGGAGVGALPGRWIHVDPVHGAVDQADKVQDLRFRKRVMPYVVAQDGDGRIVDVTRRYTSEWSRTLRARGRAMASKDGWWARALRLWKGDVTGVRESKVGDGSKDRPVALDGTGVPGADPSSSSSSESREEKELQEKVNNEPIPTTLAALKNHHVYMLAKDLNKYDGIRPGAKAAGLVKGNKVYLRGDVARLKGASQWKREGLKVRDSEVDTSAKVVTKKGEKEGEGSAKLYGRWQTEPWAPQAAVEGKVPKNEYGNVEFFDCNPAFLPPGTVHLRGEQVGRVASRLGVDYAPALTGFESKQGRQVPVMDGIIVCTEHAQVLREAHMVWEQGILEKRAKAREKAVLRRWRILVEGMLTRVALHEAYGEYD